MIRSSILHKDESLSILFFISSIIHNINTIYCDACLRPYNAFCNLQTPFPPIRLLIPPRCTQDPATSTYSTGTPVMDWLQQPLIDIVPNGKNPPFTPSLKENCLLCGTTSQVSQTLRFHPTFHL